MTTDDAAGLASWPPICHGCEKQLAEPGALYLSPPDRAGWVRKLHFCASCGANLLRRFTPPAPASEGWLCPGCGPVDAPDEDGLCVQCGATCATMQQVFDAAEAYCNEEVPASRPLDVEGGVRALREALAKTPRVSGTLTEVNASVAVEAAFRRWCEEQGR